MTTRRRGLPQSVALSLVLVCLACVCAGAEVQLSGTEDKVVLRATNATIGEIVSGIRSTLNVRVQLTGSTARQFTGAYAGSLRRVLSRLLDGEDYIISPAADGMIIVFLDRNGGARNAARAATRVAGGQEETNPVQGWVPNGNTVTKPPSVAGALEPAPRAGAGAAQPVKLAAAGDGDGNPVQGWTGSGILFATPVAAAATAAPGQINATDAAAPVKLAAADGDAENNPAQGWTGAPFPTPVAAPAPARQDATDAAKPQTTEAAKPQAEGADGNSNVQGWEPAESPFKDLVAKRPPAGTDAPASAAAQDEGNPDEGNPNVQGYMPDWSAPESGSGVTRAMPMLPRPMIRSN